MRLTRYLLPTLKEDPKDAELASHKLLLRAGLIRPLSAGIYSHLPLGWRVLRKIEAIMREEMDAISGQELHLPIAHPAELWAATGRLEEIGPELIRFQDRAGRAFVLGPTHEEVIAELARREIRSYRQLPLMLYQIQTKFRDEPRPRGGLIRVREFTMKDGYSLHESLADLESYYPHVYRAYLRIFRRCGLAALPIEADPGLMGGTGSHEFMLPNDAGEDTFVQCDRCGYAANLANAVAAQAASDDEPELALEQVATPGYYTIEAVAGYLKVPESRTAKAVFYRAGDELVFAVIRGDLEVNEAKLARALGTADLRPATEDEIMAVGAVPGYASPVGLKNAKLKVIVDQSIPRAKNLVAGANREGYHLRNVNFPRDFAADKVAEIALVREGDRCSRCDGTLRVRRGIELGHIFKLGTKYSEALGATFLDREGRARPIVMGSYGIGTGRLLAAVVEAHHDERGIVWPASIAPFQVIIIVLNEEEPDQHELGERLYTALGREFEVLFDDRAESAGVKFNDADLIGIPLQVIVGPRGMQEGSIEVRRRADGQAKRVALDTELENLGAIIRQELERLDRGLG
ncbi:MAG: proline--tRNA ligase [Candidatus Acetothermia bacterium]|jgi:prolyl-tRNA synthetase|nr:proline--tRNA ligase [Candidatus Acetothermia bacterium]MDH7505184.1 proline--tRNA ligase [Candidatus Acetothermia bacterium]